MNPVATFLQYISSPEFADAVFTGVAGNAAYDALKPVVEKIKIRLSGKNVSEDDLNGALEELLEHVVQIGAFTNLTMLD